MKWSQPECLIRVGIGLISNVLLFPISITGTRWSSYDRAGATLLAAGLVVIALASVIPVFWRGKGWQSLIAFVLLWFPAAALYVILRSTFRSL